MKLIAPLILAAALVGCATADPIVVKVPVPIMPDAPELLSTTPVLPTPRFVHPGTDDAAVCLDRDGIDRLKNIVAELAARESAWRKWYEEGVANRVIIEDVPARGFPPAEDSED